MFRSLMLAAIAAVWAGAASAAILSPGTISFGGHTRTYLIEVPPGSGPKPLVIALHGKGGTGQEMAQGTRLAPFGMQNGFVAVFPDALVKQWNWARPGQTSAGEAAKYTAIGGPPDDFGFLKALIDKLVQQGVVDAKRVYVVGFSNGGLMESRMICDDAGGFAAAAIISSGMSVALSQDCHPANAMPILIEKGTADDHVLYNGGYVLDHSFQTIGTDQFVAFFKQLDGCADPAATSQIPGAKKNTIDISDWQKCKAGSVDFYKVNGGVHTVYQVPPPAPTLWNFFKDYSL